MRILTALCAAALLVVSHDASAMYLKFLHNNSAKNVYIYGETPPDWVDVPHYPLLLLPKESFFDESLFYRALANKRYGARIRNVGLPVSGQKGVGCSKDAVKYYLKIIVDGASPGDYIAYRLYDCGWQIRVEKRDGNDNWHDYQPSRWVSFGAGARFWGMAVGNSGHLDVWGDVPSNTGMENENLEPPSSATRTGEILKLKFR
ncbi:MAG: hypothetical protein A3F77_02680 [Betaproteobacteria bacterium RIFCSPLOWO2_12_FULL_67_28]|nr:MAG: hypothetical protein A3F77_02680 [Betaproteobacteria bacterium RIFCSPLOWO2_12_FULL_67_28]